MFDNNSYPRMRFVEAIPVEHKKQVFFYLRDPLEIATAPLVFSPPELYLVTLFDGRHSLHDVKLEFGRKFRGVMLLDEQIHSLLEELDTHYYLDNPRFQQYIQKIQKEFHQSPVRKAWHAGGSYAAEPTQLKKQIDEFYTHPNGAGIPNGKLTKDKSTQQTLRAIMVPHIDLRVDGPCYTHAYRTLLEQSDAELFIILGVAHSGGEGFFITTDKDFETPLGTVETDREFLERWQQNSGQNLSVEEWAHRTEHSIEFQLPFLQHGLKRPFKIIPVLCGSLEPLLLDSEKARNWDEIENLIESLQKTYQQQGKRAAFILSVDLAHMGPKFGDPDPITEREAGQIKMADHNMFDIVSGLDREKFFEMVKEDLLDRRVDACSALYTLLSLMNNGKGELLSYGQNLQPDTQSLVSYASMAFYEG